MYCLVQYDKQQRAANGAEPIRVLQGHLTKFFGLSTEIVLNGALVEKGRLDIREICHPFPLFVICFFSFPSKVMGGRIL